MLSEYRHCSSKQDQMWQALVRFLKKHEMSQVETEYLVSITTRP